MPTICLWEMVGKQGALSLLLGSSSREEKVGLAGWGLPSSQDTGVHSVHLRVQVPARRSWSSGEEQEREAN